MPTCDGGVEKEVKNLHIDAKRYKAEDVDCKYCTEYPCGVRDRKAVCPWLEERLGAGVVGYGEAVRGSVTRPGWMDTRLEITIRRFSGSLFRDGEHRQRWKDMMALTGYRLRLDVPERAAALFLLTAEPGLFQRCEVCFRWQRLDFGLVDLRGISPRDYALFHAAKDLYGKDSGVCLEDLACAEDVDEDAFSLIINAILIARYGCAALEIAKRETVWEAAVTPRGP